MTRLEAVRTLVKLYKHQFIGLPKTETWSETYFSISSQTPFALEMDGEVFSISSQTPFALEMDGEVVEADYAEFNLIPRALRCCS